MRILNDIKNYFEIKIIFNKFIKRNEIKKIDIKNSLYMDSFEKNLKKFLNQEILENNVKIKYFLKKAIKNDYYYFPESKMNDELEKLYEEINVDNFVICPIKEIKDIYLHKSSDDISVKFKKLNKLENKMICQPIYNNLDSRNCSSTKQTLDNYLKKNNCADILLLDDYSGSGKTIINFLNEMKKNLLRDMIYVRVHLYVGYITDKAYLKIKDFSLNNPSMNIELRFAHKEIICKKNRKGYLSVETIKNFGERQLFLEYPLGFDNCQSLVSFYHNTPNNTYGLFWDYSLEKWNPLFIRQGREKDKNKQITLWKINKEKINQLLVKNKITMDYIIEKYQIEYKDIIFFVAYSTTKKNDELCEILGYSSIQLKKYKDLLVKKGWLKTKDKKPSDKLKSLYNQELKGINLNLLEKKLLKNLQNDIINPYSYVPSKFRNE